MELIFRPLTVWPGKPTAKRRRPPFKAGYKSTLDLLDRELLHLQARHVVLQVAMSEDDIRLDGRPRAGARVAHPGVVLSFDSRHGPLSYPCDTFDQWEGNLRAIALSLEHLRAVDRYGVTKRGEQYQGWTALPAPPRPGFADRAAAADFVARQSGLPVGTTDELQAAYRAAAFRLHPDRGGDAALFKRLQTAKDTLGL